MNLTTYHRPILPLLAALISGIATGDMKEGLAAWFVAGVAVYSVFMLRAVAEKKELVSSPLIFFFCLGYLSIQPWTALAVPENHVVNYAEPWKWQIAGVVEKDPVSVRRNRVVFAIRVESLEKDGERFSARGRLRVTCRGDPPPEIGPGDRVEFFGKIRNIRNFNNPGGFDYERYMAFRKIHASSYTSSEKLTLLRKGEASGFFRRMEAARNSISARIEEASIDASSAAVLKALVVGDRDAIEKPLRETFNRAGMGHLLAISGLHVGIVASFFFLVFTRLLARIRTFTDNAWVRKGAASLSLPPVVFYGFLAGMSPSTERAVIMAAVFLSAFLIEKEHDPANTLALAAMAILVVDPPALFSISFQLSFCAVSAIFAGFSAVSAFPSDEGPGRKNFLWRKTSVFFLVSLFAILGTLPLAMHYFNQVSLVGIAANFVLVPLVGFVAVPLGLISAFVAPASETVASFGFHYAGVVLTVAIHILRFFSDLPFAAVKTFTPSVLEIVLYYAFAGCFLYASGSRRRARDVGGGKKQLSLTFEPDGATPENGERFARKFAAPKKKYAAVALSIISVVAAWDSSYWLFHRFFDDELSITVVDVGQGNAAIVEFPKGKTALIDGGGFYDNKIFDVGERIVAPMLWRKKIMDVDCLFLTHPNSDHLNGLLYIAKHFDVDSVMTNSEPADASGYRKLMRIVRDERIEMPRFAEVLGKYDIGGVELKILYPPVDFMRRKETENWRDENSNSMVIRFAKGNFSCLFTGDITSESEAELVEMYGDELNSLVLIAPHHGSATSNSEIFLKAVDPKVVVFCAGWQNRFGLPSPEVIDRYEKRGVWIYRTDLNGAVEIRTDGDSTEIEPFLK